MTWEKDGHPPLSVPAPVRRDQGGLVKELRDLVKRVDVQLGTLARALEGGFTADAVHSYGWWRAELAGHPLARTVVRRLIWEVEVAPGAWRAVLPEAGELPGAPDDASVRLWHPIRSGPDAVRPWRDLLTEWRIRFSHALADRAGEEPLASTDQVRLDRRTDGTWREAPLADVPPLVFSEAMRDVGLFVGVASIAADPDWTDRGPERAYRERAGCAALTESAEAHREALERILPRLKIADRCTLDGRFLVVRGGLRTYRIHLGSADIPAVRGRPAGADPQQGLPARRRHGDHRRVDPPVDQAR